MEFLNPEFERAIKEKLKAGLHDKPAYRVEVDRLAFIPGRTEKIDFTLFQFDEIKYIDRQWIENGYTKPNSIKAVFPAEGYSINDISSHWRTKERPNHRGVDIACPMYTPVLAAWAGKVIYVDDGPKAVQRPAGIQVQIKHEGGVITKYFHLREVKVQVGQEVQQGQVIGLSGNSGHVMSRGKEITGSYDDPNSDRAKGYGAHLHFEIWVDGVDVNPYPYLTGEKTLFGDAINVGTVTDNGKVQVVKRGLLYRESFSSVGWYRNPLYQIDFGLQFVTKIDKTSVFGKSALRFDFNSNSSPAKTVWGFSAKYKFVNPVALVAEFSSDMKEGDGEFIIYSNGKVIARFVSGEGVGKVLSTGDKYLEGKGDTTIRFEVRWNGKSQMSFLLHSFSIYELKEIDNQDSSGGHWYEQEVSDLVLNTRIERAELQVGDFVYMDTLTLDNVVNITLEENVDQEASVLTLTLSDPDGYYAPDYNPALFIDNYLETPFVYQINGATVSVLSENTPIRVYLGYGTNLVRVFTGLIDTVEKNAEDGTITITARNMYKRIMEKVITEDLYYPPDLGHEQIVDQAPKAEDYNNLTREQKIVYKAQQYAKQFDVDYKLILAIAWAETKMGTEGAGRESEGSYICGYGVYGPNDKKEWAAGIDRQCFYVAKRIREAIGDRPITEETIEYLRNGGDLGPAYRYTPDKNWTKNVWYAYKNVIPSNPDYMRQYFTTTGSGVVPSYQDYLNAEKIDKLWLKSAIIHDLVDRAGLVGWRATYEDKLYPDVVIEESYLIEANQKTGKVIMASPDKEGEFIEVDIQSIPTVNGWMNPFVQPPTKFDAFKYKISDAIRELIKDTNYRSYCDRYGTYRLEKIKYTGNVVAYFTEGENLISLRKAVDFSRGRSHLVIFDDEGKFENFIDPEILIELKGEVRSAVVEVPWARTKKMKEEVARRMFWDMKRMCRSLSVVVIGNPALEVLDIVYIYSPKAVVRGYYQIKSIRTEVTVDSYIQYLDLFWVGSDSVRS